MSAKKYIHIPHGYLSYSQMSLWLADEKRYADLYFDNRPELRISNKFQKYGSKVADALEKGKATGDLLTDSAITLFPKYDVADKSMNVEVKTRDGWLKLLSKPDTFDSETLAFREYKTGRIPWTQNRADNHLQMIYYAIVIWQKFGVMLDDAYLDWAETEKDENGIIKPTGKFISFNVKFSTSQYLETLSKIIKVAKEIEVAWASHIPNLDITTF